MESCLLEQSWGNYSSELFYKDNLTENIALSFTIALLLL